MFKCEALERRKQTLLYYAILYYSSCYSTIVAKDREEDNALSWRMQHLEMTVVLAKGYLW